MYKPVQRTPSAYSQLEKLTEAVSFVYKNDAVCPGIVISALKDKQIYASVVRYNKDWINGKMVVAAVKAPSANEAIVLLSKRFVECTTEVDLPTDPLQVLKKSIIYQ